MAGWSKLDGRRQRGLPQRAVEPFRVGVAVRRLENGMVDPSCEVAAALHDAVQEIASQPDHAQAADVVALLPKLLEYRYWELFLELAVPSWVQADFGPFHRLFWQWFCSIDDERPRPFVACWPRGAGKTTTLQLAVLVCACLRLRGYVLYIGATQSAVEDKVSDIGELLLSPVIASAFPDVGRMFETGHGQKRDWRRSRVRTASGLTIDALGMDQAIRGVKIEDDRPGFVILDDLEDALDSPYRTGQKKTTLTKTILGALAPNAIVVYIQNLIHGESLMHSLTVGDADFLMDRIVSGPHPQIEGLEVAEELKDDGSVRWRIVSGTPTWPEGLGLKVSEDEINDLGLMAFRGEKQHEIDVEEGDKFPRRMWRYAPAPPTGLRIGRGWDLAATEDDGDYTVGVLLGVAKDGRWWVLDVVRGQWGDAKVEEIVQQTIEADVEEFRRNREQYRSWVEAQPGAAGKSWNRRWEQEILVGLPVKLVPPSGDKETRAAGWAATQQRGLVTIVDDAVLPADRRWNKTLVREHAQFPRHGRHDDIVDACSLAFNELSAAKRRRSAVRSAADRSLPQ